MTQLDWNEQLFEMIGRCRSNSKSKVAAIVTRCQMIVSNNPDRIIKSKAASVSVPVTDKFRVIADFTNRSY